MGRYTELQRKTRKSASQANFKKILGKSYVQALLIFNLGSVLSTLSTNQRLRIALGGFVSFTGFLVLVIVILAATGPEDMESIFQSGVMIGAVAFLGFLDVFCGFFLVFRETSLNKLFSSKKKKAENDIK
jgi:hypothetical protein